MHWTHLLELRSRPFCPDHSETYLRALLIVERPWINIVANALTNIGECIGISLMNEVAKTLILLLLVSSLFRYSYKHRLLNTFDFHILSLLFVVPVSETTRPTQGGEAQQCMHGGVGLYIKGLSPIRGKEERRRDYVR